MTWYRVKRKRPCEVCGKPDWCTYAPEAGLVLCMRVESPRPSSNSMGGWIHKVGDPLPTYVATKPAPKMIRRDLASLWYKWSEQTDPYHLDGFAMSLGVDTDSLRELGCVWADREWAEPDHKNPSPCWAFRMVNGQGTLIGIRLRSVDGGKWALKGSQNGLFVSTNEQQSQTVMIVEGPTDTAAALSLGLNVLGRPSCSACDDMVVDYIRRRNIRRAVIIPDNDKPDKLGKIAGWRGAQKLQGVLPIPNCVWVPPTKDLRQFVLKGGTATLIQSSIRDLVWRCA